MDNFSKLPNMIRCFIVGIIMVFISNSAMNCYAQRQYDEFRNSVLQCDSSVAEYVIDGAVHAYYKQYYRLPANYDDLLQFFSQDDRVHLVTLCDSLFYKNRASITFVPNPDSSALLFDGKIVFGLYSQYTCKIMLETPVQIGFHMVDTGGYSFYDDSVVFIVKKIILPIVCQKAKETMCKKQYMTCETNTVPCSIPYQYDVENRTLSIVEDCRKNNVKTCDELDGILEAELRKYEFSGIKLITFPFNLYSEE